jgi:hypothetical protein
MLSEITETPISHANFSLKIMYKIPKKGILSEKQFIITQKLKPISYTQTKKVDVTKTSFFHRKKKLSSDFLSEKHTSVTEKSFFIEKFVCHRVKFLSKKKCKFKELCK